MSLGVKLDAGDAIGGAGNLEVHVAHEVFDALHIGQHTVVIAALDQAQSHSADGGLDGHARVHKSQGAGTGGGHRCGGVGGKYL